MIKFPNENCYNCSCIQELISVDCDKCNCWNCTYDKNVCDVSGRCRNKNNKEEEIKNEI